MAVFTSIGAAIFGAGTFLATVTAAALQTVAGIGLSLIGQAISGTPNRNMAFSTQVNLRSGDDQPRSINFGWNVTGGTLSYANTWGGSNEYMVQVIALGDMPVRSLERVFVDGHPVTLLTAEAHPQYGVPVEQYRKGSSLFGGGDHLWIKFYDGTQTTADSYLTGTVSSTERPYDGSRVGVGVPYAIVTARAPEREDGEEKPLFSGYPQFKFETFGLRLFDLTDPSHVWEDPSTWGGDGDFLPVVQAYNVLRGIRFNGQWLYGLQDMTAARLPAANWITAISKCRALINTSGSGTEPQYRSGGELSVDAPIADVLDSLMAACQGRISEVGGSYKCYVGEPGSAIYAFTDADVLSTEEQNFTPFLSLSDSVNGVQATWPNPAEAWNSKTAAPYLRTDLEALDGNRRLMARVALDMVPYGGQVQRLQKSAILEAQRARRHTLTLGPEAWVLEPGDIVQWTSERNGYIDKLFRVDGVADKANLDILLDLTEVDPSDYDWTPAEDYTPIIDGPVELVGPQPLVITGWQVFPAVINDEQGRPRRPGIEVWYDSGRADVYSVRVQVRPQGGDVFYDAESPYGAPFRVVLNGEFAANTIYEVRGIYVRESGQESTWSAWLDVTTPDVKLGPLDVDFEDVAEEVGDFVSEMMEWTVYNTRETIERVRRNALIDGEGSLEAYNDRQGIRQGLTSTYQNAEASWSLAIDVATGPDSALAQSIEELRAEVYDPDTGLPAVADAVDILAAEVSIIDGELTAVTNSILLLESSIGEVSASGLFRVYTSAAPSGANARIALSVSATAGGAPTTASMFLDAMSDGTSEIALVAGRVSIVTGTGGGATKYDLFTVQGGVAYISNARIINLQSDNLSAGIIDTSALFVNGVVITDVIAENAVTQVTSAYTAGSIVPGGGATVQTLVVASQSGWSHIITAELVLTGGGVGNATVELRNGGTPIRTETIGIVNGASTSVVLSHVGSLSPGNNTITVYVSGPFSTVSGRMIKNLLTKR